MEDFNFNMSLSEFDLNLSFDLDDKFETRYIKPPKSKEKIDSKLFYANAEKLAKELKINKNDRYDVVLNGSFVYGDFIEAFIVENNFYCEELIISTLSMNQNNVDSLHNLIKGDYVDEMNLIISDYFYSHEKFSLLPYLYEKLDIDNKFQLAAAGSHCKIVLIKTDCGKKFVFHGSANLRSSSCLEQICLEENESLFDFHYLYQKNIIDVFKTINKSLRGSKLWQAVQTVQEEKKD